MRKSLDKVEARLSEAQLLVNGLDNDIEPGDPASFESTPLFQGVEDGGIPRRGRTSKSSTSSRLVGAVKDPGQANTSNNARESSGLEWVRPQRYFEFPKEVLPRVWDFLSLEEVMRIRQVCKKFKDFVENVYRPRYLPLSLFLGHAHYEQLMVPCRRKPVHEALMMDYLRRLSDNTRVSDVQDGLDEFEGYTLICENKILLYCFCHLADLLRLCHKQVKKVAIFATIRVGYECPCRQCNCHQASGRESLRDQILSISRLSWPKLESFLWRCTFMGLASIFRCFPPFPQTFMTRDGSPSSDTCDCRCING